MTAQRKPTVDQVQHADVLCDHCGDPLRTVIVALPTIDGRDYTEEDGLMRTITVLPEERSALVARAYPGYSKSKAVHCTCGVSGDGPAYVPNPRVAWRHMSACPHSRSAKG